MEKKLVFLDLDGVVNSYDWDISPKPDDVPDLDIDPKVIERLNSLYEETMADFVMTSDWRTDFDVACRRLVRSGANFRIVSHTPIHKFNMLCPDKTRGAEIEHWFADHGIDPDETKWIIIDDRTDWFRKKQMKHVIKTNPMVGYVDEDLKRSIEKLNG